QPDQVWQGLGDLVHQPDRSLLVRLEVVDQRDLLFEALLLVLVALDLFDDRLQAIRFETRARDLLLESVFRLDAHEAPDPAGQQAKRDAPEEEEVVEPRSRRKDRRLLPGRRGLGLGEKVDADQAASSPM